MDMKKYGKPIFAIVITTLLISVSGLSYFYLDRGQEAFTGTDDDSNYIPSIDDGSSPITANPAPDFTYAAVNGGTISLSGLRGKVVVLDFMATWCQPCKTQMVALNQVKTEYAGQDLVIVSLDVDTRETASQLLAFRNEVGASWDFVLDSRSVGQLPVYDASNIPTIVFIGRDGAISSRDVGVMDVSELKAAIDPLL